MQTFWRKNLGVMLVFLSSAIPVFLWLEIAPWRARFGSLTTGLGSVGQLAGLVGFVLFAWALFLASRHPLLKILFPETSLIYKRHHLLGVVAFILLLLHPLALFLKIALTSLAAAFRFLIPTLANPAKIAGVSGLTLMTILLLLTLFGHLRYDLWKKTHRFLGLAFFFGSLHLFLLQNSDLAGSLPLRVYIFTFAILGLIAIAYNVMRMLRMPHPNQRIQE